MINRKTNESGYTLIGVLIIFTIMSFLGLSIVMLSLNSVKTSQTERDYQSAYYIAEAGLTYYMEEVKSKANEIYERDTVKTEDDFLANLVALKNLENEGIYEEFENVDGHKPKAEVDVTLVDETDNQFKVTSIGYIGDEQRTVEKTFSVKWKEKFENKPYELPPLAVLTSGMIDIHGGKVKGSVATHLTEPGSIKFDYGKIESSGDESAQIFISKNASPTNIIDKPDYRKDIPVPEKIDELWELPNLPEFPSFPDLPSADKKILFLGDGTPKEFKYDIKESQKLDKIEILGDRKLILNIGNTDKELVIDNLLIEQGHIVLKGTGKLTIYVNNDLRFGDDKSGSGDSRVNENGDPNRLNIFLKGSGISGQPKKISVQGNQWVYGSLFAEDADIDLLNSGRIYGNIFTYGETITISGSGKNKSQLILAPNADVAMEGSASIHGMVISKTYSHPGNATITFGEPFILDGPISPSALGQDSDGEGGGSIEEETGASPEIITIDPIREVRE